MKIRTIAAAALLTCLVGSTVVRGHADKPPQAITEPQARQVISASLAVAKGDPNKFWKECAKGMRKFVPPYAERGLFTSIDMIHRSALLGGGQIVETLSLMYVTGPAQRLCADTNDQVRKMEGTGQATPWSDSVDVHFIFAEFLGDIEKVLVTRNGVQVSSLDAKFQVQEGTNRTGGPTRHVIGDVSFPREAFLSGAAVIIIGVPKTGKENLSYKFSDLVLQSIQ